MLVTYIGEIAEQVPCISPKTLSKTVDKIFSENSKILGVVTISNDVPLSLISRADFYEKMGNLYGYNLYMGRPIEIIANNEPLIVDYFQSITDVSKLAMERKEEDLYDYIIVTKENKYIGIVSIQRLLMKLVEVQVEFASYLNPLTRLPGNHNIEKKLKETIYEEKYSVLYIDLDNFKSYNDTYGFKKGDKLLKFTANMLKTICDNNGMFLGHIGGDDFVAVIDHNEYEEICQSIIEDFDEKVKQFYDEEHLSQKYVIVENRKGDIEKVPLVSLSIAVVTNKYDSFSNTEELSACTARVKKSCKKRKGSCWLDNQSESSLEV
ncbi:MAG TPA: GGDEF domain-containing protein [Bacillaceae bacterium]|nr:GGDEF domain-containing protein [Bacillaceae bacterium]